MPTTTSGRAARSVLAGVGTAALALSVAACGSHASDNVSSHAGNGGTAAAAATGPAPAKAIRLAAAAVRNVSTAHVDGTMHVKVSEAGQSVPVDMHLVGDMRWGANPQLRVTMSGLKFAGIDPGSIQMLMTSKAMWMSMPILTMQTHKKWLELKFTDLAQNTGVDMSQLVNQSTQLDPSQYVELLTASGNLHRVGSATVDGAATTHYAGDVDPRKAMAAVGAKLSPQVKAAITKAKVQSEHIDVWIDGKHQIRREDVAVHSPTTSMTVSLHLSHYGVPVHVTPPPASQTMDFSSLMSGIGGLGG